MTKWPCLTTRLCLTTRAPTSRARRFRGLLIALEICPKRLNFSLAAFIFEKAKATIKDDEAQSALAVDGEAAETRGHRSDRGIGVVQFVGALLRVAHALHPELNDKGIGVKLRTLMEGCVLPLHAEIARPTRFDAFLRSRAAAAVFEAHKSSLLALFRRFSSLDRTERHAMMHAGSLNVLEWLTLLTTGGWFQPRSSSGSGSRSGSVSGSRAAAGGRAGSSTSSPKGQRNLGTKIATGSQPNASARRESGDGIFDAPPLTPLLAIRVFVEVNLEDIQLDLVRSSAPADNYTCCLSSSPEAASP